MKEVSAGGVVFNAEKILLLKKFNGGWVLPKGHVKKGEVISETAIREVKEETGVTAEIGEYIDSITYEYYNFKAMKRLKKTVHWFVMYSDDMHLIPLNEEGFNEARYIDYEKAINLILHKNERLIIKKALDIIKKGDNDEFFK